MKKVILGVDNGFGDTKYSYRTEEGKIKSRKFSSVAAVASDEAIDMPLFEGKRYYLGNMALLSRSGSIISMEDYESLEKVSPLFLWKIFQDEGLSPEMIEKIVIGLSFAHIKHAKRFIKRISKFKVNGETFDLSEKIVLVPQGVGAKYMIEANYANVPESYLINDIGFLTLDSVDVVENTVRPENVHGEQGLGVIKIARNVQEYIADKFSEHISIKEAKKVLEEKKFFLSGEEHDLSEMIEKAKARYTRSIMDYLQQTHAREFKKYRKIFFVGGGAHLIKPDGKLIEIVKRPEYANSIGNLIKGEKDS